MKKCISLIAAILIAHASYGQIHVTKFMGIPVDGFKNDMVQKLEAKGFSTIEGQDGILEGEFNGTDVYVHIVTNNNKVYRIMVVDANYRNETDIKIRFNNLCYQFAKNENYMSMSEDDQTIGENEDISYQITARKKRYQAIFFQKKELVNDDNFIEWYNERVFSMLTEEEYAAMDDESKTELLTELSYEYVAGSPVWFMIDDYYGEYGIVMFYDNELNKAQGEDL